MSIFFRKSKKENSNGDLKSSLSPSGSSSSKVKSSKKSNKKLPKKTIESLPNIILSYILNIVSDEYHDSVADNRLVCKLWGDIICKSVSIRINFSKQQNIVSPRGGSKQQQLQQQSQIPLGFYHIQRTILKFSRITFLSFRNNRSLDVELLSDLFSGSNQNKKFSESLQHLDIGKMELEKRDPKMQLINRVLLNFPNLMVLDISENEITSDSIQLISENLKNGNHNHLSCLNLSLNPIGEIGASILGSSIFKDNNIIFTIRSLNLRGCDLNENSLKQLLIGSSGNEQQQQQQFYNKASHKLHTLLLGHNNQISYNGGIGSNIILSNFLKSSFNLQFLDLEYCSLGTAGESFDQLLTTLSTTQHCLSFIDLTNNQINISDSTKQFEENIEKIKQPPSTLKFISTQMNKWCYQKRENCPDHIQLAMLCQKQQDFRYLLVDCLKSIQQKGYYNFINNNNNNK